MQSRLFVALLILAANTQLRAQDPNNGLVNWLDFKEAQEKNKEVAKPFIIDFYTDWCGWCKHMMKTTYSNPNIAAYINQHFYPIKFNAETKDTIEYNGKIYKPLSDAPRTPHELTIHFLGERMSYPSTVFVTNNFNYSMLAQGFLEDKKLEPMLIFMVENAWQTAVFDDFNKHFTHTFYDTVYTKTEVKVHTIQEVEQLQKKEPRKVLVSLGAPFCNSGKVMDKTTFSDTAVAAYINKHFYLVKFDVTRQDTLLFKNEKHFATPVNNFPMHTLAFRLTNNKFTLPALCLLDEQLNTIDVLSFYQSPQRLHPILHYIGKDIYKKQPFNAFMEKWQNKTEAPKQ